MANSGMSTYEHPKRVPPPLSRAAADKEGRVSPVVTPPFVECGQRVYLRGVGWVECVRRKGHPVTLNCAHSNGLREEWAFDTDEAHRR